MALAAAAAVGGGCGPTSHGDGEGESAADTAPSAAVAEGDTVRSRTAPETVDSAGDAATAACPDTAARAEGEGTMEDTTGPGASIHEVLERNRDRWMETPGVVGTGIGRCDGAPCLVIYLRELTDELEAGLPDCVEGHPVRLEETGRVRPRNGVAETSPDGGP